MQSGDGHSTYLFLAEREIQKCTWEKSFIGVRVRSRAGAAPGSSSSSSHLKPIQEEEERQSQEVGDVWIEAFILDVVFDSRSPALAESRLRC
ncbi:unnamed protein product [Lampetra planeri]